MLLNRPLVPISVALLFSLITLLIVSSIDLHSYWSFFYILEWSLLIGSTFLVPYIGLTGFFTITAITGICTAAVLLKGARSFLFLNSTESLTCGPSARLPGFDISFFLYLDPLSYSFGLLTALIGSCVYLYAFSYMRFEKNALNFLIFLQIFKLSMMLLVWAGNWVTLILGWELIGVSSFLLINYWTVKITTLKSAFKALSFNKLSDAALISAACMSLWLGAGPIQSTATFVAALSSKSFFFFESAYAANDLFLFCICIASFCKSAQLGFHFWLPDSMEAPVPASALIHSATLVSAGIYLIMRFSFCFLYAPEMLAVFKIITSATALYGAVIASFQTDVKKILAYSTISHCGMLMFSITLFEPFVTIFYLFAHGFFKSLNFLCVGNFIQYANNYQDISRMGGFATNYVLERFFLFIAVFNLSSFPMFIAFFSKHWLFNNIETVSLADLLSIMFVILAAFCGFFYSARLFYETLFSKKRSHYTTYAQKNVKTLTCMSVKKANTLGHVGMVALFLVSLFVLYVPILNYHNYLNVFDSTLTTGFYAITVQHQAVLLLTFSLMLLSVAFSYISFKRYSLKACACAVAIVIFILLLSII